jgi:hypothetical protein
LDERLNEYFNIFEDSPENRKKTDAEESKNKMRPLTVNDDYFL